MTKAAGYGRMEYSVGRIPGQLKIDPDAGGQGQQRKRQRPAGKDAVDAGDSVAISAEARRRAHEDDGNEPEEQPAP